MSRAGLSLLLIALAPASASGSPHAHTDSDEPVDSARHGPRPRLRCSTSASRSQTNGRPDASTRDVSVPTSLSAGQQWATSPTQTGRDAKAGNGPHTRAFVVLKRSTL